MAKKILLVGNGEPEALKDLSRSGSGRGPERRPIEPERKPFDYSGLWNRIAAGYRNLFTNVSDKPGRYHDTRRHQNGESYKAKVRKHKKALRQIAARSRRINRLRAA